MDGVPIEVPTIWKLTMKKKITVICAEKAFYDTKSFIFWNTALILCSNSAVWTLDAKHTFNNARHNIRRKLRVKFEIWGLEKEEKLKKV